MFKRVLLASCASGAIGLVATTAHAATADASASAAAAATSSVTELVVTAEKREQSLQHVAIAITAFTAAKRDAIGINSIQDMTNFTPGLTYSTSTDRITLRGVGRTTNVLSADAPVANYDDGLYETFAVAAGRSSLELAQVDRRARPAGHAGRTQRAGRLAGRGHPAPDLDAAGRVPVDGRQLRPPDRRGGGLRPDQRQLAVPPLRQLGLAGAGLDQQHHPRARRPRATTSTTWYADAQIQAHFNDHLDMWTKFQSRRWSNPSGGPGDQSAGWTKAGFPTYEFGVGRHRAERRLRLRARLHGGSQRRQSLAGGLQQSGRPLAVDRGDPDRPLGQLPAYYSINTQWTWHADGFDIKYIGGGTYYHYELWGPTEGNNAPISSYPMACGVPCVFGGGGLVIHPTDSFTYEENNGFWSDELNFISTGNGPLQWVAGVYQFYQHYQQWVSAENLEQPQLSSTPPRSAPAAGRVHRARPATSGAGSTTVPTFRTSRTRPTARSTGSSRPNGS